MLAHLVGQGGAAPVRIEEEPPSLIVLGGPPGRLVQHLDGVVVVLAGGVTPAPLLQQGRQVAVAPAEVDGEIDAVSVLASQPLAQGHGTPVLALGVVRPPPGDVEDAQRVAILGQAAAICDHPRMPGDESLEDLGRPSDPPLRIVVTALGTVDDAEIAEACGQIVLELVDLRMGCGQRLTDLDAPLVFGPRPVMVPRLLVDDRQVVQGPGELLPEIDHLRMLRGQALEHLRRAEVGRLGVGEPPSHLRQDDAEVLLVGGQPSLQLDELQVLAGEGPRELDRSPLLAHGVGVPPRVAVERGEIVEALGQLVAVSRVPRVLGDQPLADLRRLAMGRFGLFGTALLAPEHTQPGVAVGQAAPVASGPGSLGDQRLPEPEGAVELGPATEVRPSSRASSPSWKWLSAASLRRVALLGSRAVNSSRIAKARRWAARASAGRPRVSAWSPRRLQA